MFTIVFYHERTHKVFMVLPLELWTESDDGVDIYYEKFISRKGFRFKTFSDCDPVFYTDADGDICLKENCFVIHSGDFME